MERFKTNKNLIYQYSGIPQILVGGISLVECYRKQKAIE